jgi:hypothetical protein
MARAKVAVDMRKLERSLRIFGRDHGESASQAIMRWGVQTCRELAVSTAVFGGRGGGNYSAKATEGKQHGRIWKDALSVLLVVDELTPTARGYKATNQGKTYYAQRHQAVTSPAEVNYWIRINRTRRRRNTAKLTIHDRKVAQKDIVDEALKLRYAEAGQAKAGWLAAGKDMASGQVGMQRLTIGSGFLRYAQKTRGTGRAKKPISKWSPEGFVTNNVAHSRDSNVLAKREIDRAMVGGIKNTIRFYAAALRAKQKKRKP